MKILKNDKLLKLILSLMLILALVLGCIKTDSANTSETNNTTTKSSNMYVAYSSHIQDKGWESDFSKINGESSGTTGQNKKNEAIKIKLINAPSNVGISYQTYVQGIGWQNWQNDGKVAGTTGQNKRMEAIKIKLTGTEDYSVEYRTHVQDIGWMSWMKDGEISGVAGKNLKVEAIEIRIIPKTVTVIYQSHVQDIGWEQYVNDGDTSGTIGKGLKIEGIRIELKNATQKINIKYQTHIQDIGWENTWKQNGEQSGTTGQNKKIEAIKIRLDDLDTYSIMYRTYVQGIGWQEWKKDGEIAGTTGQNKKVEALEIKVVKQEPNTDFTVRYTSHVQDIGWVDYEKQGITSGVIGQDKKIEAIKIVGKNIPQNVKIKYKSHVQDLGWEKDWKENGVQSGTTGQNKKIEAVKIKLEGTDIYSIAYRTYVNGKGWQNWANDGETSGTTGKNLKVEAIEIKIVPKIKNKIDISIDTAIPKKISQGNYKITGWLMTDIKNVKIQVLVDNKVVETKIDRTARPDVLETVKGYGGEENNPKPGFEITIDFRNLSLGNRNMKIQFIDESGKVLKQEERNFELCKLETSEGIYGKSGLKIAGKGGSDLKYYKFGSGENVFFATFAMHGYEDLWGKDGEELVTIANNFYNKLIADADVSLADKWTIYIFPGVNQDGLKSGWTNNGPGRTTLFSQAPGNKGIDMNRCWQIGNSYTRYNSDRNYNGTSGFQSYEAQALRDFFVSNKSKNAQTVLVDLHGWTQQLIGDPTICAYYEKQFPENDKSSVGRYGSQYMINWARTYLASNSRAAKSALIELPNKGINGHQSVVNNNFSNRYINATLAMLKSII